MFPWQANYWTPERLMIHRRALIVGLVLGFLMGVNITLLVLYVMGVIFL